MKVLVIFTGGTIGSSVQGGFISPDNTKKYKIIEQYRQLTNNGQLFDTLEPYTILSENIEGSNLTKLMEVLTQNIDKYDGIIVTHGTDTVQYTAAALTYAFGMNTIPIVLVSSNRIIENEKANGVINFKCAVDFINNKCGKGIFVSYKNDNSNSKIHVGNQLLEHGIYEEALYSLGDNYYGSFDGDTFIKNSEFKIETIKAMGIKQFKDKSPIMLVKPYVGMTYPDIQDYIRVVLFTTYHSGTINTNSEQLKKFVENAHKKNVKLKLIGLEDNISYESTKEYAEIGIEVLPMASPIAAYMKLWMEETDE